MKEQLEGEQIGNGLVGMDYIAAIKNSYIERDTMLDIKTETIAPEGLGYGEGSISVAARLADPEDPLTPDVVSAAKDASLSHESTVAVTSSCDTCSDGRCAGCVKQKTDDGEVQELENTSYLYKIFGGGVVMTAVSDIVNGKAPATLTRAFRAAAKVAQKCGVQIGAHSSTHATEVGSDCGAIDKAPAIMRNALRYEQDIRGTMSALFSPETVDSAEYSAALDEVFSEFRVYVGTPEFAADEAAYRGADVVDGILDSGAPVKILKDKHREVRARVIIDVDGHTTNQQVVREKTDDVAQVFAWDIPRNREIAMRTQGTLEARRKALLAQMVYSLSTASTLTAGDLPVDIIYANSRYVSFDF